MTNIVVLQKEEFQQILLDTAKEAARLAISQIHPQQPATINTKMLTAKEVASMLGVSYNKLMSDYIHRPNFPNPTLGGGKGQKKLWAQSTIENYLSAQR